MFEKICHGQDSNQQAGALESNALTTRLRTTDANWSVTTPCEHVLVTDHVAFVCLHVRETVAKQTFAVELKVSPC